MNVMLDTHVMAWFAYGDPRLSNTARRAIGATGVVLSVSAVTAYEYADLVSRGRLGAAPTLDRLNKELEFAVLDFTADLWRDAVKLPAIHRDPIDRMMIAHARSEGAAIITADEQVRRYPVETLW